MKVWLDSEPIVHGVVHLLYPLTKTTKLGGQSPRSWLLGEIKKEKKNDITKMERKILCYTSTEGHWKFSDKSMRCIGRGIKVRHSPKLGRSSYRTRLSAQT